MILSTVTLPGQTVVTTLPGSTDVITSQLPASTFVSTILVTQSLTFTQIVPIITTVYETDYYPAPSSIEPFYPPPSSSAVPSVSCSSGCQIDVTATRLAYPGTIVVSTVTVPTVTLEISTDDSGIVRSTGLYTRPLPVTTSSAITWEFSGVPLTYPTVYAAYATFNRVSVSPVDNVCQTSVLSLALPTPTDWPPLIIVESLIPTPTLVAPRVVSYLNTLPTVIAQLGGPIGANACDPIAGPLVTSATNTLGSIVSVTSVPAVSETATITVKAQLDTLPSESAAPLPPSATPLPPASSAAPPPPSETPLPPPSSATPQPSSEVSLQSSAIVPSSVPSPPPPSPSSASPESSRADSASQVPSAPASSVAPPESSVAPVPPPSEVPSSGVPSSVAPPPPVTPSRSTTSSRTTLDGTASGPAASSSFSYFTGAAALPTGNVVGWLVGAAGVGLGLI